MNYNRRKPRFPNRHNDQELPASTTSKKPNFDGKILISLLIFLSIFPLACVDVWFESAVFFIIFVLCGIYIHFRKLEIEYRRLLTPLFILAGYSFFQGLVPLFSQFGILGSPTIFPASFDAAASVWSALKIFGFAVFIGLLANNFRQNVKFLSWSLILTGTFFAVLGIARFLLQADFPSAFEIIISPRLSTGVGFGTFFNQNHFAFLMLMAFGLNAGLFWFGKQTKGIRSILFGCGLTCWCALVLTGSRGGIISSFAVIAVLFFTPLIVNVPSHRFNTRRSIHAGIRFAARQLSILSIVFGISVIGILLIGQDRIVGRFEDIPGQIGGITSSTTFRRTDVWQAAIEIIKEHPLFGIGFGGFHVGVSRHIDTSGQLEPGQAHNDYLELAASSGVIGVAFAAFFLLRFSSLVKKRFSAPSDDFTAAARVGAICGIAGVALHSFFDFGLQITANLLFFAALLFIAVHKTHLDKAEVENAPAPKNTPFSNFLFSILCLILACLAALFGFARYRLEAAKITPGIDAAENHLYKIPFDAAYYETKAGIYEISGKTLEAVGELKTAIIYRPQDYNLWLKLGRLEHSAGHQSEAENAFRRAVELAPRYGKTHFSYGNFLLAVNRKTSGLEELRLASRRNPQYFADVVDIVWLENAGNTDDLIKALSPLNDQEREQVVLFMLERSEFPAMVQLVCREEDLAPASRDALVKKLLENKNYYFAAKIQKRDCDISGALRGEIEHAGFESGDVKEGIGFGWRVPSLSDNTSVGFDNVTAATGRSLRFDFNGQESSSRLLSQTIVVEKKHKYQLHFSSRTSQLITGKLPVLQLILRQSESENIIRETKLALKENEWTQFSVEFETGAGTQALEIRLARQACPERLCPIFGKLWLDDFVLQSLD
jgi:O-antigen ligase/tetratricopeptide (TPR) repeat protein